MKSDVKQWVRFGMDSRIQQIGEEITRLEAERADIQAQRERLQPNANELRLKQAWRAQGEASAGNGHRQPEAVTQAVALLAKNAEGATSAELARQLGLSLWHYRSMVRGLKSDPRVVTSGYGAGRRFQLRPQRLRKNGIDKGEAVQAQVVEALRAAGGEMTSRELRAELNLTEYRYRALVTALLKSGRVRRSGKLALRLPEKARGGKHDKAQAAARLVEILAAQPDKQMLSLHLRPQLGGLNKTAYRRLVQALVAEGRVRETGKQVGRRIALVE